MKKDFIVRQKSLSALQSKQFSNTISDFMNEKSKTLKTQKSKQQQSYKLNEQKDEQIRKLKLNLQNAMSMATSEALASSRAKQQTMRSTQSKLHIQQKYSRLNVQIIQERQKFMKMESKTVALEYELQKQKQQLSILKQRIKQMNSVREELRKENQKLKNQNKKIAEIDPLKKRIVTLQHNLREAKIKEEKSTKQKQEQITKIQQLQQKIKKTKPFQQQLQQRIAYLERVNLQLERKMEDFNRREHQYKKQISFLKNSLNKMTIDRNKYKLKYEETFKTLEQKLVQIQSLEKQISSNNLKISELSQIYSKATKKVYQLQKQLKQTKEYFQHVIDENKYLTKRNKLLQQFEDEERRVIAGHIEIAEEINLYIIDRNSKIEALQAIVNDLKNLLEVLEEKYIKFDKLFEDGSIRGQYELKQSFYAVIRDNSKLKLEIKEVKLELEEKVLKYGEERDKMQRKIDLFDVPPPNDEFLVEAILADKTSEIIMIETSNDQLRKIKQENEEKIQELERRIEGQEKQISVLKLKASQLYKIKKDLQESKETISRYQEIIEQKKNAIEDLEAQAQILRKRSSQLTDRNFTMDMENKNLVFRLQQLESLVKELDVEALNAKKVQNDRNSHTLSDCVDKLQSGIKSLSFYFSCCFCHSILTTPITLAPCGHNYCLKCKDAYSQYCYQCDTGEQIHKTYTSKFLKETISKYKFLLMMVQQTKKNLIKIIV